MAQVAPRHLMISPTSPELHALEQPGLAEMDASLVEDGLDWPDDAVVDSWPRDPALDCPDCPEQHCSHDSGCPNDWPMQDDGPKNLDCPKHLAFPSLQPPNENVSPFLPKGL